MPTDASIKNHEADGLDLAFEYVLGTLRGSDRANFEKDLRANYELQDQVAFWQENLQSMQDAQPTSEAPSSLWQQIEAGIQATPTTATQSETKFAFWRQWFWAPTAAFSLVLALMSFALFPTDQKVDYLAVLTSASGEAALTAITYDAQAVLQLQFAEQLKQKQPDQSLQLWARSKRDNQVRPIFVIKSTESTELALSEAQLRLIRDAESLILSLEELGGSAIDEPSETILARGPCVRMAKT